MSSSIWPDQKHHGVSPPVTVFLRLPRSLPCWMRTMGRSTADKKHRLIYRTINGHICCCNILDANPPSNSSNKRDNLKIYLQMQHRMSPITIGGHRHRPLCRRYPTSDIDISYSDIGTKYVALNPLILISEQFRYQLLFRYRTKLMSDISISKIGKSFPIDQINYVNNKFISLALNLQSLSL